MALSDIVTVTYVSSNPGVTAAGFGVPMIVSPNATWTERIRFYSDISDVADDWGTATPEYLAAEVMFSQSTGLSRLAIGRAANKPTQRYAVGVVSAAENGVYSLRVAGPDGSAWTSQTATYTGVLSTTWTITTAYALGALVTNDSGKLYVATVGGTSAGAGGPTGTGSTIVDGSVTWDYVGAGGAGVASNDAILYNLKTAIDAFAAPTLAIGTSLQGTAGARTLRILANVAGGFFGVEATDPSLLTVKQDHADPGVAADLAAIWDANKGWYGVVTLYNSDAYVLATAAWVESAKRLYTPDLGDTEIILDALSGSTDVAKQLKDLAYARTGGIYHPAPDEFAGGAMMARWFPISPGGDNWIMKSLAGITAKTYSATHETNLRAKFCNWYSPFTEDVNLVQGRGLVFANEYIDIVRFRDWYENQAQVRCANLIIQNEKLAYIDEDITKIEAQLRALNTAGIRARGIAADPEPTYSIPTAASAASADRAARILRGVETTFRLAGAINELLITVSAQP